MCLVFDVTDKTSFEQLDDWLKRLEDQGPERLALCILGNKIDLTDSRIVSKKEAEELAQDMTAVYQETSAFINVGIDEAFVKLVEAFDKGEYAFGRGNIGEGKNFDKKRRRNGESLIGSSQGLGPVKTGDKLKDKKDEEYNLGNSRRCC